ncbi:MAG: T9SS type A sorting domain-containing protein, partial [Bacteroidales bacterium]|nr:T9SS type A sorting domain-containing protein [Bacteroidales bacterium]
NITVSNELTLNSGIIDLGANTLFLTNSSSSSLVGGSTSGTDKYILGKLQRTTTGTGTYTFPIGYTGHGAQGLSVKLNSSSGTPNLLAFLEPNATPPIYSIAYCDVEAHPGGGTHIIGTGTTGYDGILDKIEFNLASALQWDVTNPGGGISSYNITVYGNGTNNFTPITTVNGLELRYLMKNGEPGNTGVPTGTAEPSFSETGFLMCPTGYSLSGLTSFSHFDLRGADGGGSVLPVELFDFTAECNNSTSILKWSTASETNNDYFILEKSKDMLNFFELTRIEGAGNSNTILSYSVIDNELFEGDNYYRLKQVDFDGRTTIYNTISINCDKSAYESPTLIAYPNPFTNELNVVIENLQETEFVLELYDNIGKLIFSQTYSTTETSFHTILDMNNLLPSVYNLRSRSDNNVLNVKVVKK